MRPLRIHAVVTAAVLAVLVGGCADPGEKITVAFAGLPAAQFRSHPWR